MLVLEAIWRDEMVKKSITVEGIDYPSVRAAAKVYGLAHGNVTRRLLYGWTIDQAFELEPPPQRKAPNARKLVTEKGIFNSIRDAANAYGLEQGTIAQRLRLGWTDKQAVGDDKPPKKRPRKGRSVVCKNKEYPSVNEFADAYGVNRIRTRKRLDSGWTPEEAVGLKPSPPRFRNQDGSVRDHAWTAKAVTKHGQTVPVSRSGKYTLYLLTDRKTSKEYVGVTTGDIKTRLRGHWNLANKGRQSKLYNRMRKALAEGRRDDFVIETLRDDARSFEELQEQEYPASRSRGELLRSSGKIRHGRVTKTNQPPVNPARFTSRVVYSASALPPDSLAVSASMKLEASPALSLLV